jgi:signal transduction histidine kinase
VWVRCLWPHRFLLSAVALLGLLAVLATLQYRWIGEVSQAERQRLQASLDAASSRFADDFDRELTRTFLFYEPVAAALPEERLERLAEQGERWAAEAPYPRLVRDVFLLSHAAAGPDLERWDRTTGRLAPAAWPPEMAGLRARLAAVERRPAAPPAANQPGPVPLADDVPALVLPLAHRLPRLPADRGAGAPAPEALLVVQLDAGYLRGTFLPELARRHFAPDHGFDDVLTVVRKAGDDPPFYRSAPLPADARSATGDAAADLFGLRPFAELHGLFPGLHAPHAARVPAASAGGGGPSGFTPSRLSHAHHYLRALSTAEWGRGERWRLIVTHRAGSLEAAVAGVRYRNLAVSFGILLLLGASMIMLLVSTRRAQGLARQQLEFVAGVSHELNTPLTAIRSAGRNLADGVVAAPQQVRRYGAMIESEGRRLSGMVAKVLELAGMQSAQRGYRLEPVAVESLVQGALEACRWAVEEQGARIETSVPAGLPPVLADPTALRHALQNLLDNALKYAGREGPIRVSAGAEEGGAGAGVYVSVRDSGPGIGPSDLRHIFEPFYRGRNAAAVAHGSGLGLSLVRRIVEAHGGRVSVASGGGGSAFTIHLAAAEAAG